MSPSDEHSKTPRLIILGGFLGAGKTTLLARLGAFFRGRSGPTAMITNASGGASVDAIRLRHAGFEVEQVTEDSFGSSAILAAARKMRAQQILIEAPGSAANLQQIVQNLRKDAGHVAPLTVLVDPARAGRLLGQNGSNPFSENVAYLFRKQLEEASLILINQGDLRKSPGRSALENLLPSAHFSILTKEEQSLESWMENLNRAGTETGSVSVDSARCQQASAELAALNAAVNFSSVKYFDGNNVLLELAGLIQSLLQQEIIEIAHLKIVLASHDTGELASVHATSNDSPPELQDQQTEPTQLGRMVLNLRAAGDPELLHSAANRALLAVVDKSVDLFARMEETMHFRPGPSRLEPTAT